MGFSVRSTAARRLKQLAIPIREEEEILKINKGQLAYGERLKNHQVTVHKKERRTIERMKALHSDGYSYWKIAAILNSMKIPTKNRNSRWHATTVMKILGTNRESEVE